MSWEVWDRQTCNLIDVFDSRDEALTVLRDGIHKHGAGFVATFQLVHEDPAGHVDWRMEGGRLAELLIAGEDHQTAGQSGAIKRESVQRPARFRAD